MSTDERTVPKFDHGTNLGIMVNEEKGQIKFYDPNADAPLKEGKFIESNAWLGVEQMR